MNKRKILDIFSSKRSSFNIKEHNWFKKNSFLKKIEDKIKTRLTFNKLSTLYPDFEKSKIKKKNRKLISRLIEEFKK